MRQTPTLGSMTCTVDADCPLPGAPCQLCADASVACPTVSASAQGLPVLAGCTTTAARQLEDPDHERSQHTYAQSRDRSSAFFDANSWSERTPFW